MSDPGVDTAKIAGAAQRSFGLHLLRDMVDRRPRQNVFISPLSVFLALDMAENASAGATRSAMRKVLELPDLDTAALHASVAALQAELKSRDPAALTIANALWTDRRFTLDTEFVKLCTTLFSARASSLDFRDPHAAAEINDWVKAATNDKIPSIVSPAAIANAAVILTNAVYFAATWRYQFAPAQTQNAPFHLTGGATKSLPMMHQARLTGAYRAGTNFEGAMLDYKQSGMFLCALLPREGKTPKEVLASLDPEHLTAGPPDFDLDLKLPRFGLDFSASLADSLESMGMDVAFHSQADFSPMGSRHFFISDVIHKTRLEVDEKGTVAAAATAVTVGVRAVLRQPREVKTLVFDRPFVVLIGDSQTGALLFAGAIEEP